MTAPITPCLGKKLLVTGGAGFIGANLIRKLLKGENQVTVLDSGVGGDRAYLDGLPIEVIDGDVRDAALVRDVVPGHDGIVHLAAQAGVPSSVEDPGYDLDVNVIGTFNILEAVRDTNDTRARVVLASSSAPLGRQKPPASEDKAPLPISPYGASKLAAEAYCLAYHGTWGIESVVLRFSNVYGPFSRHKSSVVAKFISDLQSAGELTLDGDGSQTRDFIYVDDLCHAVELALVKPVGGELFQIATGTEVSITELAALIMEISEVKARIVHTEPRLGDIDKSYSAIGKAAHLLHWGPSIELAEGLRRTWDWFTE
jgi:UDP-glucose 4-epimerase